MSIEKGILYIVATPIGNLGDISQRAIQTLEQVDRIAAEDTRHSARLLQHLGIKTPCLALHEHNERQATSKLLTRLQAGESIALISDAGTPLLSDPGYHLVREMRLEGIKVVPIPGPSAISAALSAAGLPTDRFRFEGFLPSKQGARQRRLNELKQEICTLVFFEAPHRILETLQDMADIFGHDRQAVLARELTKTFETVHDDVLGGLVGWVEADENQRKGEIVILIHGAAAQQDQEVDAEIERVLKILMKELPLKQATSLAASITGSKKNRLYQYALSIDKTSEIKD